ncbi:MAG TPA: serine hydrolase domain-containing protein [Mycobacteriales bacterium]|nr:serine hydrolase domain-containing protein [Mycobacteriales bacterium]HVX69166.1 serine hydrolase domain-containing protein [Mycobacteriales bacterium]
MSRLDEARVSALLARARRDVDEGVLPAVQVALGYQGEIVAFETYGAPAHSRFVTFSVTKAFTGGLTWLLMSEGALRDSTRVAEVVPEFAANDKQDVTVEHLLTHTAGFPRAPMRPEEGADREQRRKRLASWRLDWKPGTQTEYHPTSAYWALVEVIDEMTGADFRQLFADRIAAPLGIPGLTLGATGDVVRIESVGVVGQDTETLGDRVKETGEGFLLRFNEPEVLASGVPGAGAVGTASDVATFYQALLHNPGELWDPQVLADATGKVRNTMPDPLFNCAANRTLGLVVAGDDERAAVRGFGAHTSPRAFGCLGVGGQIAWADPETGLSFSYITSGLDVDVVASFTRSAKIAGLAARCAP